MIAKKIASYFPDAACYDVCNTNIHEISNYNNIIIGSEIWGDELDSDWKAIWEEFEQIDKKSKNFALFGHCDGIRYEYNFGDGMNKFYQALHKQKAKLAGLYYDFDYDFFESKIYVDNGFLIGLVVDEENQSSLTDGRVHNWCQALKNDFCI